MSAESDECLEIVDDAPTDDYLTFMGNQFNKLFNEIVLNNLAPLGELPSITGDILID